MKQKKARRFQITLYSGLVLLILLGGLLKFFPQDGNPLLNKQNAITLYRVVEEGQQPNFRTEDFFPNEKLDYEKVTYDTSSLDVQTAGVYVVPVLYDGEETNCVVQVTVKGDEAGTDLIGSDSRIERAD